MLLRRVPLWLRNGVLNLHIGPKFKECRRGEANEALAAIYGKSALMTRYFFAIRNIYGTSSHS